MKQTAPNLIAPHGFFGRGGGVSTGLYSSLNCGPGSNDSADAVAENRQRASKSLTGGAGYPVLTTYQVHGTECVTADRDWGMDRPKADAIATNTPGLVIAVLTADCAPVLLQDAKAGVIGAAHAGWRGAVGGITDTVIDAMVALGADRGAISAAVGPAIGRESFEVRADMQDRARSEDPDSAAFFSAGKDTEHFQFDLAGYLQNRLKRAHIGSVWTANIDTYASDNHFSFRRTTHRHEGDYGRQLSAICLTAA